MTKSLSYCARSSTGAGFPGPGLNRSGVINLLASQSLKSILSGLVFLVRLGRTGLTQPICMLEILTALSAVVSPLGSSHNAILLVFGEERLRLVVQGGGFAQCVSYPATSLKSRQQAAVHQQFFRSFEKRRSSVTVRSSHPYK